MLDRIYMLDEIYFEEELKMDLPKFSSDIMWKILSVQLETFC